MYTLCKFLYITVFALLSAAQPYLQLYYHNALGFSSNQIGLVLAIAPFIQSFACPLWTGLVDKRPNLHGVVMAMTSFIGGVAVIGIMLLGHIVSSTLNKKNSINDTDFDINSILSLQSPIFLKEAENYYYHHDQQHGNNNNNSEYIILKEELLEQPLDNATVVWITSALALIFAFFALPNVSLVDSAVMKILGPNKILYGEQRMWGSVSTGLTILIVGVLMDISGNVDVIFWVFGVSTISFITCALMTNVTNNRSEIFGGSGQEDHENMHGFCPSTLINNDYMRTIEGCDPKQTLLVNNNNYNHYQEKEKASKCNNKSYQSISLFNNNKNNSPHSHYTSNAIDINDNNGACQITHEITTPTMLNLPKTKSGRSILSTAHTLRDEASEQVEDTDSMDPSPAISRKTSLEDSMGALVFETNNNNNGESSSGGSNIVVHSEEEHDESLSYLLFKSPRVLCFLITTLLFGIVLSMIVNFLFLFLNHDLHTPTSWIGWTGPLGGITELFCFCFSKQMTECLGTTGLVIVSHAAIIVRCLAYTILPPDTLTTNISALLLQTLHGIGFGIFWGTAVKEMDALFPPRQRAMAQGILGALHTGLGTGGGALIGGYLYQYFGAIWLFRSAAALACASILIFGFGRLKRFDVSN
ncbi:major facilitator superfamily domain-containing protein [Circinella umbellata]|nr:major facilitator superfamily domain-containing protein [Circinella umbellata]